MYRQCGGGPPQWPCAQLSPLSNGGTESDRLCRCEVFEDRCHQGCLMRADLFAHARRYLHSTHATTTHATDVVEMTVRCEASEQSCKACPPCHCAQSQRDTDKAHCQGGGYV